MAKYSGKHVHELVLKSTQYSEGNIGEALESGFLTTDEEMLKGRLYLNYICRDIKK